MLWRSGAQRYSSVIKLRINGRALLVFAFLLLAGDARWTAATMIAAAVHELGHLTALWILKRNVYAIELEAWGAVIRTEPLEPVEELLCAAAGPCAGLVLCLFWSMIPRIGFCALVQAAFNLIPLYPLDGGRVLLALRNMCCKHGHFGVQ